MVGIISVIMKGTYPFVWILTKSTNLVSKLLGIKGDNENKITEDFGSAIQEMKKLQNIDNTDNSAVNLLYWQDTTGVHCIATDEDMLSLNINK